MIDDIYQYIFKVLTFIFIIISVQFLPEKNRFMNVVKFCCFFIIFFLLHYISGLPNLGILSISQIWRMSLLGFLLLILLFTSRRFRKFEKTGYWYASVSFLCPAILTNPFSVILFAVKQIPTILFFNFWNYFSKDKLERYLVLIAQVISLSSLVTLLGIIEPLNDFDSADMYMDEQVFYSSIFASSRAASSYFAAATVILGFYIYKGYFRTKLSVICNWVLMLISLYSLYLCYIRTGWFMLFVMVFLLFFLETRNLKQKIIGLFLLGILALGVVGLYQNNEAFRTRISGQTKYNQTDELVDLDGSGRLEFWANGIRNWAENDAYSLFFGKGLDAVKEDNYRAFGMEIFSHNLFVDTLCQYGLISLILLVVYNVYIFLFINRYRKRSIYGNLTLVLLIGAIIFNILQSEIYFNYAVLMSLSMALIYKECKAYNVERIPPRCKTNSTDDVS